MTEISFAYWNALADQTILIGSLLGGFSIAVTANIIVSENTNRLLRNILIASTLSASFFLITVFAMTKLLLMTTDGYPVQVTGDDLTLPRLIGSLAFYLGIISLIAVISMAGWTKSRSLGRLTTAIGLLTLILIFLMTM